MHAGMKDRNATEIYQLREVILRQVIAAMDPVQAAKLDVLQAEIVRDD